MEEVLLFLHVLAGMAWVGGAVVLQGTLIVARRSQGPEGVDRVMQSLRWADTWLAIPAPALVLATGVALVFGESAWSFTQAWILASIGLVVAYEIIAATVGGRLFRQVEQARQQGLVAGAAHAGTMVAWVRLGLVLLALLVAVVALMVFKPGL